MLYQSSWLVNHTEMHGFKWSQGIAAFWIPFYVHVYVRLQEVHLLLVYHACHKRKPRDSEKIKYIYM